VLRGICFKKIKNHFYDLNPISQETPLMILDKNGSGKFVSLNFCNNVPTKCGPGGLVVNVDKCKFYGGSNEIEKVWTHIFENNRTSIDLKLPQGDICTTTGNVTTYYETHFRINCAKGLFDVDSSTNFDSSKCNNTIIINSVHGCRGKQFSPWYKQFGIPKEALAVILILGGLYFLIFGQYFGDVNSLIINCSILGMIMYNIFNLFANVNILICMVLGIALSFVAVKWQPFNSAILGIVVGYLFGNLFYNLEVKVIGVNPQVLYWVTVLLCIVFIAVAGGFMQEYMVCLAGALIGSFALVRGISIYAGGYPDEVYVMTLLNKREYGQFGRVFGSKIYLYIGLILLFTLIGMSSQSYFVATKSNDKPAQADGGDQKNNENPDAGKDNKPQTNEETNKPQTNVNEQANKEKDKKNNDPK